MLHCSHTVIKRQRYVRLFFNPSVSLHFHGITYYLSILCNMTLICIILKLASVLCVMETDSRQWFGTVTTFIFSLSEFQTCSSPHLNLPYSSHIHAVCLRLMVSRPVIRSGRVGGNDVSVDLLQKAEQELRH